MVELMIRALELLPQPAALYEDNTFHLLGLNSSARRLRLAGPVVAIADGRSNMNDRIQGLLVERLTPDRLVPPTHADLGETYQIASGGELVEGDIDVIYATRLLAKPRHPRPDLIVLTAHSAAAHNPLYDHLRMALTMNVNESSTISIEIMERALEEIGSALSVQRHLIEDYNLRMGEFLANGNTPKIGS